MSAEVTTGSSDLLTSQHAAGPVDLHADTDASAASSDAIPESRLALLHRAAVELNSSLDLNAVLQTVLRELTVMLRADSWAVWLSDPTKRRIRCVLSEGPFSERLLGLHVSPNEGALGWVIAHGQSIRIDNPETDSRYNDRVAERVGSPPGSLLLAPLIRRGEIGQEQAPRGWLPAFGVITVISRSQSAFTDEDLNVLEALAAAAAGAIVNAQLFGRANEEVEQRRLVERALRHSESQYRTMVETSPDGIVVTDLNGIIINCNLRTLELHGYEQRTDVLGKGVLMLFAPGCRAEALALHREIVEGHAAEERELSILRKDGSTRTVIYAASLVAGENGSPLSIVSFSHDVTDRREAEDAVRRHNQELRTLNRIATHISQVRDVDTLLATVLRLAMEVMEADFGCALLFSSLTPHTALATTAPVAGQSLVLPGLPDCAATDLRQWLEQRLRSTGRAFVTDLRDLPFPWATATPNFQIGAVPLTARGQTAGVLAIGGIRGGTARPIRGQERQLLSAIGHQVSVAVENAALTAEVAEINVLREMSRVRSELVAAFSHDLRTPLGLIQMACSTLQRDDIALDADLTAELLNDIQTQSERLSRLVDGILDLGHLESGQIRLDLVDLDVAGLVLQVSQEVAKAHPNHEIAAIPAEKPLIVWADRDRVDQVIRNVLDNAVKYSPQGSAVAVHVLRDGYGVRVAVSDEGIGIPPDQRELVFERFFRIHTAFTASVPGTGLGLATCRAIIEAHGGRIWIEPHDSDQAFPGTTVVFTLPGPAPALQSCEGCTDGDGPC